VKIDAGHAIGINSRTKRQEHKLMMLRNDLALPTSQRG